MWLLQNTRASEGSLTYWGSSQQRHLGLLGIPVGVESSVGSLWATPTGRFQCHPLQTAGICSAGTLPCSWRVCNEAVRWLRLAVYLGSGGAIIRRNGR